MIYSDLTEFPKHPDQDDNDHLLKVIFKTNSGVELTSAQARQVCEGAGLDDLTLHRVGIASMGKEGMDELMGIFVNATSQEDAEEALGRLTVSASIHGYVLNRRTFNQSQF